MSRLSILLGASLRTQADDATDAEYGDRTSLKTRRRAASPFHPWPDFGPRKYDSTARIRWASPVEAPL